MNMPPQTETVLARLIERVEGRYYGKYRGIVSDNNDPNNLGRVKASVPRLLGDSVTTGWALPAFAYGGAKEQGFFAVADIGAGVWIEFEGGDLRFPIWSGTWYTTDAIPESAKPGKKVLKTKSGHKIVLDDDANSLTIADSNGNTVTMDQDTVTVTAGKASKVVVNAPKIELAGSSHPVALGDQVIQYLTQLVQVFNAHTHPGELAAGMFPVSPMVPAPSLGPPPSAISSKKVTSG
jgi:phage baseplate assembly protein gpV